MKPSVTDHNARHAIMHFSPSARSPSGLCYFFLTELSPSQKKTHNTKPGSESTEGKKGSRSMSSLSGRAVFLKPSVYIVVFHNKREMHFFTCHYRQHCSRISTWLASILSSSAPSPTHATTLHASGDVLNRPL